MRTLLTEGLGTFVLVLTLGLTTEPLAIGFIYMCLVYIAYQISGAHFNPAISLAFFIKKELKLSEFLGYSASHIAGAFIAASLLPQINNAVFFIEPPANATFNQQFTVEILFSFLWVFLFLVLVKSRALKGSQFYGLVLGFALAGFTMIAQPISGAVFNPASSIGTSLFDFLTGGESYRFIPFYTLCSLAGSALAIFLFSKSGIKESNSLF